MIPGRETVRVEVYTNTRKQADAIQKRFGGSIREVKSQNWAALAPQSMKPIAIRSKLIITGEATESSLARLRKSHPGRDIISIPADLAFGTGHHATTATVLRFLVDAATRWEKAGKRWSMADFGCGTGILAIASARLGAKDVWGCDFDPQAVKVARANARGNQTPKIRFTQEDVLAFKPTRTWDCVAANIFSDVLEAAFPTLVSCLAPGGLLLVSGILHSQSESCLAAGRRAGLTWNEITRKGKWVTACGHVTPGGKGKPRGAKRAG